MTHLELFNECLQGGYSQVADYVSYKIINRICFLQCSREKEDWLKNFDIRPTQIYLSNTKVIIPRGYADAIKGMLDVINNNYITGFVGYSHGAAVASLLSGYTGKFSLTFGCPHLLLFPSPRVKALFYNVETYNNKTDIVSYVPPIYSPAGKVYILEDKYIRGRDNFIEALSGHSPDRYRQNLAIM
jgi:hypothetical protein